MINDLFQEIKLRHTRTYDKYETQQLSNARIMAKNIRKRFYQVTGLDQIPLANPTDRQQKIVNDILLFQDGETAYSDWEKLPESKISEIYRSLLNRTANRTIDDHGMLIYSRIVLQLPEKTNVNELASHVGLWCELFPRSTMAHLFRYMIHFPVPNGSLKSNVSIVKSSIGFCKNSIPNR